ncbi:MAG: autotransporter assembly complex protein TamA, partial [Cypionkella sp.]
MYRGAGGKFAVRMIAAALLAFVAGSSGQALDRLDFSVTAASKPLDTALRGASVLLASKKAGKNSAQEIFADARAEYASLLNALYARGYYSGVIHVYVDGVEAASIAPLNAPARISAVKVVVEPGPAFAFSKARIAPLAPATKLPPGFAIGKPAESGVILEAVTAGVDGWRDQGHAKAKVADQSLTADHANATLSADVALSPGPKLQFGTLKVQGADRMRVARVRAIAGLPEGKVYRPRDLETSSARLRRTGVFKSAVLVEDDAITAPDLLGITANVVEEKRRRYTFGAEIASSSGVSLNGEWLHRNLFGGGERLTISGDISNIGAQSSGMDYSLGANISRPATFDADTTAKAGVKIGRMQEADFDADYFSTNLGLDHIFSDSLTGSVSLAYDYARVTDPNGVANYRALSLPIGLVWDRRDSKTEPTRNIYVAAEVKPFLGFGITDNGTRATLDLRGYKAVGAERRVVFAARVQAGAVFGADLAGTPRDYLFYSGGAGTVRGQPYQSLGVNVLRDRSTNLYTTGGKTFIGGSLEARVKLNESLGLVGFFDIGRVDAVSFFKNGGVQSGAGIGVRYATPVGPIRLDVAAPVSGNTGDGVQVYVGLGQS